LFGFGRLPGELLGLVATGIEVLLLVLLLGIGRGTKAERKKGRVR
jgi:hypothetical protein